GPWQLHGIEKSQYAYELAQVSIWIGYIQWQRANGYRTFTEPILRRMDTFECKDAVLNLSDPEKPTEPDWPEAEFIVGNPPFLGGKKMRTELDRETSTYVNSLFTVWKNRVKPEADLCCYWFEKARHHIEQGNCKRAGLLATQGIRGGANRETVKRIKASGDIFFAESDRPWILEGANVHVSMIGFDKGTEVLRIRDGKPVAAINSDLSAETDITKARRLKANLDIAYMGDTKGGKFDIDRKTALTLLSSPNPGGSPGSDVVLPWINGLDVTRRHRDMWIIDFGTRSEAEASLYEEPFEYVRDKVYDFRQKNNRQSYKEKWWLHVEPRPSMWGAIGHLSRFIVTPTVAKHRLFVWCKAPTVPDHQLIAFASTSDYFFGILHSRLHEVWALKLGTRLETRPRYTPTTSFETFPFPDPTDQQRTAIAAAAKQLDERRTNWLNPRELVKTEVMEFTGSVDGLWSQYIADPDDETGTGTVRYPQVVSKGSDAAKLLAKRTLTNLYNARPTWLDIAHRELDQAVFAAYGWDATMTDDAILAALLALNLERDATATAVVEEPEEISADEDNDDEE